MNEATVNSVQTVLPNGITSRDREAYPDLLAHHNRPGGRPARIDQQWNNNYVEGNAGIPGRAPCSRDRFRGGTLRFALPIEQPRRIHREGRHQPDRRWRRQHRRYGAVWSPVQEICSARRNFSVRKTSGSQWMSPRIRYDHILTKNRTRGPHTPPVAGRGTQPDTGVPANLVTTNGSGSCSPDGLPIAYQWTQQAGPLVTLASPTSPRRPLRRPRPKPTRSCSPSRDSLGGAGTAGHEHHYHRREQADDPGVPGYPVANSGRTVIHLVVRT